MNKLIPALVSLGLNLGLPLAALADAGMQIKPGLWEIQNQASVNGQAMPDMQQQMKEMQSQMANMPPEMQERMKGMMSQNGSMGMGAKGMTICLTQEQINRSEIAQGSDHKCKTTDIKRDGNKTTMKMHCDAPQAGDMTTEVTRISDTEWKSVSHMKMGQNTVDSSGSGKWLKADCGAVKPMSQKVP